MIKENSICKSQFVGYFCAKNNSAIENNFILPIIEKFFVAREIKEFKSIKQNAEFTDLDFDQKNFADFFPHFYEFIVDGIYKNGNNFEIPVTYCITLDKENCPKICKKTEIYYDEVFLFDTPVFYFIYVDIKEIFSFLRANQLSNY